MLDPYRMVAVNVVLLFLVIGGIYLYRTNFPSKKINYFYLLFIICLIPVISIFRKGVYESGDFTIHIYRAIAFYDSLREGNIMPSWAGGLNATYGYPLFIFNYPLPYYIISFFHFIGFSFITSMKLFLASSFITSSIGMYLLGKELFKKNFVAFIAAIVYTFTPYHLVALHFKNTIGELVAFSLLPFLFYFLHKMNSKKNISYLLTSSLIFALLIMSHVVIALFSVILSFGYFLLLIKKDQRKIIPYHYFFIFSLGSILSAYVWLPPFFLSQYTYISLIPLEFVHFPSVIELLYSPWRMGFLFQGPKGEIAHILGYSQIVVLVIACVLLLKKRLTKVYLKEVFFWTMTSLISILLILPYSKFIWGIFPFLKIVGSHRILILFAFCCSILSGYIILLFKKQKKLIIFFLFITIFSTILNWGHRRMIPDITDTNLRERLWKSTSEGEAHFYANSKWVNVNNPWFSEKPDDVIKIVQGKGKIKVLERLSTKHTYIVNAESSLILQENTLYFPGWKAISNNQDITVSPDEKGIIRLRLSNGLQLLTTYYRDDPIYYLLKQISLFGFITLLLYYLRTGYKLVRRRTKNR